MAGRIWSAESIVRTVGRNVEEARRSGVKLLLEIRRMGDVGRGLIGESSVGRVNGICGALGCSWAEWVSRS